VPWEVTNQAGVHLWYTTKFGYPIEPIRSIEDAVARWPETATSVAVRLRADDTLQVVAPVGLDDLLGMVLRRKPAAGDARLLRQSATRRPAQVRSLTLLEPALFLNPDDPEVAHFKRMGDAVLTHGLETDSATLREFLQIAGAPGVDEGLLPDNVANGVRRAHGSRSPGEASPALDVIRDAGIPSLVATGGHTPAVERMCDALATALNSQRLVAPGAGHFVAAAPGFADRLEQFLTSVG
jgi:hypothetical protein